MNNEVKRHVISARIKVLSPLTHFGDTVAEVERRKVIRFRRINILCNGVRKAVPVYSANGIRGPLRRHAAQDMLDHLELKTESMVPRLYYILFSGGGLGGKPKVRVVDVVASVLGEKAAAEDVNNIGVRQWLAEHIPVLGLFGCSYDNTMIEGCVSVGFCWPVAAETQACTGVESDLSVNMLIERAEDWDDGCGLFYTRRDDLRLLEPEQDEDDADADDKNGEDKGSGEKDSKGKRQKKPARQQMIYSMEYMLPGTELVHETVGDLTDVQAGCLYVAYARLAAEKQLGGRASTGHGRVEWNIDLSGADPYIKAYREHLDKNAAVIKQFVAECNRAWER